MSLYMLCIAYKKVVVLKFKMKFHQETKSSDISSIKFSKTSREMFQFLKSGRVNLFKILSTIYHNLYV
jgi:hypothetical protein